MSWPYEDALARHFGDRVFVRSLDGRFAAVTPGLEQVLGMPAHRLVGHTSHELFPAAVAARHLANDRLVVQENRPLSVCETSVDAHGFARSYVAYKFPIRSADGEVIAIGGLPLEAAVRETQQRCAQSSATASETRFRAVFDHAPIGQIYSDLDGRVTSVNEAMARMLGYTPEEIVGRASLDFVQPDELPRVRVTMAALLEGREQSVSTVRRFLHRDGHDIPVRVSSALLRDDTGAPHWWVSMVADISEAERTQAELEAAHGAAVLATQRTQLLHKVAAAANEASSAGALAVSVLGAVCEHFGWAAGALVAWSPTGRSTVVAQHGSLPEVPPVFAGPAVEVHEGPAADQSTVIVPIADREPDPMAFVFAASSHRLDPDQYDVLDAIAREGRRLAERELSARLLQDSEARFRSVFDSSPLPMGLTLGDTGTYSAVNDAMCAMLGRTKDELLGASARDICHPDDVVLTDPAGAAALAAPDGRHTFEIRLMHASGEPVIANVTLAWMDGADGARQLLGQFEDITARRTVEQMLRRQADHDGLTGLANRGFLGRVLAERAKGGGVCSALFIDVDGFKLINDTRGHDVGDEVLLTVATRLLAAVRPTDLVVRFGGDEFVVLCDAADHDAYAVAAQVAQRVKTQLAEPIPTRDGTASITASIGIAAGVVDMSCPLDLVQRADAAMYEAKRLGKDRSEVYDVRLHERTRRDQHTEAALRNALADDRFVVHYQPVVSLDTSEVVGFEALVRLVDEAGALVMPDRFIAVAERSGLIVPMGAWVLRESCRTVSELRRRTGRPLTVAVNIAARQAARADLAETVRDALEASGLPDAALTLELTESALLEADDSTLDQLVGLRHRGVDIGLDDFGTGYSSLTYLRRFPVSHLKVDRSFVSGVDSDASDRAIVRAVTQLADELGLGWVAEGIETDDQLRVLSAMGSGLGQGYLFSRPVPTDQLAGLLGLVDSPLQATA